MGRLVRFLSELKALVLGRQRARPVIPRFAPTGFWKLNPVIEIVRHDIPLGVFDRSAPLNWKKIRHSLNFVDDNEISELLIQI